MKPAIVGARNQIAMERLTTAAQTLGERFCLASQVEALAAARNRDPQLAALFQREAVAELLDALARATAAWPPDNPPPPPDVTPAVPSAAAAARGESSPPSSLSTRRGPATAPAPRVPLHPDATKRNRPPRRPA